MGIFRREGNTIVQVASDQEVQAERARRNLAQRVADRDALFNRIDQPVKAQEAAERQAVRQLEQEQDVRYRAREDATRVATEEWVQRRGELERSVGYVAQVIAQYSRPVQPMACIDDALEEIRDRSLLLAAEQLHAEALKALADHNARHPQGMAR